MLQAAVVVQCSYMRYLAEKREQCAYKTKAKSKYVRCACNIAFCASNHKHTKEEESCEAHFLASKRGKNEVKEKISTNQTEISIITITLINDSVEQYRMHKRIENENAASTRTTKTKTNTATQHQPAHRQMRLLMAFGGIDFVIIFYVLR